MHVVHVSVTMMIEKGSYSLSRVNDLVGITRGIQP